MSAPVSMRAWYRGDADAAMRSSTVCTDQLSGSSSCVATPGSRMVVSILPSSPVA